MKLTKAQANKVLNHPRASTFVTATEGLLNLVAIGMIKNAEIDTGVDTDTINDILGRKPKPKLMQIDNVVPLQQLLDRLFIVYAHAGRSNGWALVTANNKTEARKFARQSGWLETGTVDSAETLRNYLEDMGDDVDEGFNEHVKEYPLCNRIGFVQEIDWGT